MFQSTHTEFDQIPQDNQISYDLYKNTQMSQFYNCNNKISSLYCNNEYQSPIRQQSPRKSALLRINQTPKPKSQYDFSWVTPAVHYNVNSNQWMQNDEEQYQISSERLRRSVPNLVDSQKSPTKHIKNPIVNNNNNLTMSQNDIFFNNNNFIKRQHSSPQRNNNKLRQSTPSLYSSDRQLPPHSPIINSFQKCSYCNNEIGKNSAMIIETLNLSFHLNCFRCSVCSIPLSNGKEGTDVRVRGNKLHCNNCFSNDRGKFIFTSSF
jgi:hypothetical protein